MQAAGAFRYAGVADAMVKMARQEGLTSLQKGLVPGMIYQIFMNGTRLGCYPTAKRLLQDDGSESLANVARGVCAGAATGGMGAVVGSPFFMVKCRLQAQSTASGIDGFQHHYKGMIDGLIQARLPFFKPSCSFTTHTLRAWLPTAADLAPMFSHRYSERRGLWASFEV